MTVVGDETAGQRSVISRKTTHKWVAGKGGQVPTASPQTSQVVNKVIKLLEQSRARSQYSSSEHFHRTLRLWEAATRRAEMDEWLQLCEGMWRGLDPLAEALAQLAQHAWYSNEDALGLVYMNLNLGDVRKGQFFTPFAVARMIAEMTLHDLQPPYGPAGPPLSFYEPACGSGVLFLAVLEVLEERFPFMLKQGLVTFTGNDIDPTAVLMTTLNLRLRGVPTDGIRCQNSLALMSPSQGKTTRDVSVDSSDPPSVPDPAERDTFASASSKSEELAIPLDEGEEEELRFF